MPTKTKTTKAVTKKPVKRKYTKKVTPNISKNIIELPAEPIKEEKKPSTLNRMITILGAIIAIAAFVLLIIFGIDRSESKDNVYLLKDFVPGYENQEKTITLPSNYCLADTGDIFTNNENGIMTYVGTIQTTPSTEEEFIAMVEETKIYYDNVTEDVINDFKVLILQYDYNDTQYENIFLYENNQILQLIFIGYDNQLVLDLISAIK